MTIPAIREEISLLPKSRAKKARVKLMPREEELLNILNNMGWATYLMHTMEFYKEAYKTKYDVEQEIKECKRFIAECKAKRKELLEKAEDPEKYYIEVVMQDKIKLYFR